jgi:hypothetical protein
MIQPTSEERDLLAQLLSGVNRDDQPLIARMEPDGTLRIWGLQIGLSSAGETKFGLEVTGEQRILNLGTNGTTIIAVGLEPTGEQRMVLMGWDGAALIRLLTNDLGQLYMEPYEHWVNVPPVEFTNVDIVLWNPGLTSADLLLVEFEVYAFTGAASVVTLYQDIGGVGTPSNLEYIMNAESLASKARNTFVRLIKGDDDLRGLTTAGNDANLHLRVRQVKRT